MRGQRSIVLPKRAGDWHWWLLMRQLLRQHPSHADDLCLKLYPGSGIVLEKISSAVLLGLI